MEILEEALKTIPGLALLFAIVALIMLEDTSEISAAIRVFLVAWSLYKISSQLDGCFDLAYGPEPRKAPNIGARLWAGLRKKLLPGFKGLEQSRTAAAAKLDHEVKGLYKVAQKNVAEKQADEWKGKIAPLIGFSKVARAFIFPFLLISIAVAISGEHRLVPQWLPTNLIGFVNSPLLAPFRKDFVRAQERLDFLFRKPAIPAVVCLISVFLYVLLRLRHMRRLYDTAAGIHTEK